MEKMETNQPENSSDSKSMFVLLWVISLIIVGVVAYFIGKNGNNSSQIADNPTITPTVAGASTQQLETPTPEVDLTAICKKTGVSQKKDYLVSYTIKPNDSIASIAKDQLGDSSRDSEIIKLNDGANGLTIGSTLYLPPPSVKRSAGNISEVSGRIVGKDNGNWHLSFGGGTGGPGIYLPTYWFQDITDKDSYQIGDCVTILFDNGVKVFTITKN